MPTRGRPRLTPEAYQARLTAYCSKYAVAPSEAGIPPFPSGRRETAQHREWIALYKVHQRLRRRSRNECQRCLAPVSDGSVFCESHRTGQPGRAVTQAPSIEERRAVLGAQHGLCPICRHEVDLEDPIDDTVAGRPRALLHQRCRQLVRRAEELGSEGFDRLRLYVWPRKKS